MLWCSSNKTWTLNCLQMTAKLISVIFHQRTRWETFLVINYIYWYRFYENCIQVDKTIFILHTHFLTPLYQGGIIIYGALWLFDEDFVHVVSITFTALILTELLMVALTIRTWHWAMAVAEVFSLAIYIASLIVLRNYFGKFMIIVCPQDNELHLWIYCSIKSL